MIVAPKLVSDPLDATRIFLPPGAGVGAFYPFLTLLSQEKK